MTDDKALRVVAPRGGVETTRLGESPRKREILDAASAIFAASGPRASLQEIADACGIQAPSIYHHFASKEAILVDLLRRYHHELDVIGEQALEEARRAAGASVEQRIGVLASAVAECAFRNRATLRLSFKYSPVATSREEDLAHLVRRTPDAVYSAMLELLRAGRAGGSVRPEIDLLILNDLVCRSMLNIASGAYQGKILSSDQANDVASDVCQIMFHGLATRSIQRGEMKPSPALMAANDVVQSWPYHLAEGKNHTTTRILQAARVEFGRRGFEATTIRDIAAAAGVGTRTIYRAVGPKEEVLATIMQSYASQVGAAWNRALEPGSPVIERLDALLWVSICAIDLFSEEFKTELADFPLSGASEVVPDGASYFGAPLATRIEQVRELLVEGQTTGELSNPFPMDILVRHVLHLLRMPETVIRLAGRSVAFAHARDTVLRGTSPRTGPAAVL